MIAGIDSQADIDIYLTPQEIESLPTCTLEGTLVKVHAPKRQGIIKLSLNDARKNENGFGVGFDDSQYWGVEDNFLVMSFIGNEYYKGLLKEGIIGTRHRMRDGAKINLYNLLKLSRLELTGVETLKFYRDNKDRLPERFG